MELYRSPEPEAPSRVWWGRTAKIVLVVLTMVGAVVWFVVANVIGFLEDSNHAMTELMMKKMEEGLTVYSAKNEGKLPERLEDATQYFPGGEMPVDAWGNAYVYIPLERPYVMFSLGKDGERGGVGADADVYSFDWK